MTLESLLPTASDRPEILVLAAEAGDARSSALHEWVATAEKEGRTCWYLPCDHRRRGLWAGLETWLHAILPEIERAAPDLITGHDYELLKALPSLRKRYEFQHPNLTESAPSDEAVRNYALDRAFRIGQGLVDLLAAWYERSGGGDWVVVCDDFEHCGALVQRFFQQLVRRRARTMKLTLVFAIESARAEELRDRLHGPVRLVRAEFAPGCALERTPEGFAARAEELEALVGRNQLETEIHLAEIIDCWQHSTQPRRALRWQAMAFGLYNHYGFYEDARVFCEDVVANLDELTSEFAYFSRWNLVGSVFGCLVATGEPERAYRIVEEEGLEKADDPVDEARISYVLAMLHCRFLPRHDFAKAESFINRGLAALAAESVPEHTRRFLSVFLRNGLAFIRHRQGNPLEAIRLCEEGYAELDEHLPKHSHRLHRSVLLYNIAQVYAALASHEKAIESFTAALEMDPNYSEYHNERGSSLMRLGRFDEAVADFHRAIEVSPPYPEVWTNLGQCYRQMDRAADAEKAYSRALDLDPDFRLALIGRSDVRIRQACWEPALEDFETLLVRDTNQPLVLANRAAVFGRLGRFEDALADLDRAVSLAPNESVLHYNRAFALAKLGRPDEARASLDVCRGLAPQTDFSAVMAELGLAVVP